MAGKEEVKLFGVKTSPYTIRVEIALKIKGVEYEYIHETLSNKSDLLLKYNPVHKKVPVLLHNGNPLAESLEIVEYIDDTWKINPILPSDTYQRAQVRFWSRFVDKFVPGIFKAAFNADPKVREKCAEESLEALQVVENELKHKFFNGDSLGLVDILGLSIAYWLPILQEAGGESWSLSKVNAHNFPKVQKWFQEILNYPIVRDNLPPRERILERAKFKFDSLAAAAASK